MSSTEKTTEIFNSKSQTTKVAVLGSTKGFGQSFYQLLKSLGVDGFGVARGAEADFQVDFSKEMAVEQIRSILDKEEPTHIYYFAAGGPYGSYDKKEWKDHMWAFRVTYLFPAQLLHFLLQTPERWTQFTLIGSSIAEDRADPFAVSYSAAKHALLGLHQGLVAEKVPMDLRLFSPGYLDTSLLPPNAWPRQQGLKVEAPERVAQQLWDFSQDKELYQQHWLPQEADKKSEI